MVGEGGNKWKFIETTIFNRFWENKARKLPKYFCLLKSPEFSL